MEIITGFGFTLLSFIVVLSLVVFIHEFGHYIIAKLSGVKIETFSIGFGKELIGFNDKSGTRWKFSLLPLGGYVKMFGDQNPASVPDDEKMQEMTTAEKEVSFHYKPLWKKAAVVVAGPLFNFLTAIAIFTYFIFSNGITSTEPVAGEIMPESAAIEAGVQTGDRFLQINGEDIASFHDIPMAIMTNLGTAITAKIDRAGEIKTLTITPKIVERDDGFGNKVNAPLIGIKSQEMKFEDVGLITALGYASQRTYEMSIATFKVIGQLVGGDRSVKELKGPIGIAKMSGQAVDGGLAKTLWFIALISVNLGLINLLPVPMLDGGHLLFYAVEAAQGRPLAYKVQEYAFKFGFVILMSFMAFTIVNDVANLF